MSEQQSDHNQTNASSLRAVVCFFLAIVPVIFLFQATISDYVIGSLISLVFIYAGIAELFFVRLQKRGELYTDRALAFRYLACAGFGFLNSLLFLAVAVLTTKMIHKCVFAAIFLASIFYIIDSILKYRRIKREMNSEDESSI
ncbi:MAG: hypothetical protein COA78_01820 [Blastopirellula sp.]|nr:MAG: hypothetical protein COA78_01820 [Blastopirellula sp.]